MSVDRVHEAQGSAPGINDVLNLESSDVFYGAQVITHSTGQDILKGNLIKSYKFCLTVDVEK